MIYYAHPITIYNTPQEERDIDTITKIFPSQTIYNPSKDTKSNEGYKQNGMEYFLKIVDKCNILIFRGIPNNYIPAGVMSEINRAKQNNVLILELPSYFNRELSVEDTRVYLKESGSR